MDGEENKESRDERPKLDRRNKGREKGRDERRNIGLVEKESILGDCIKFFVPS